MGRPDLCTKVTVAAREGRFHVDLTLLYCPWHLEFFGEKETRFSGMRARDGVDQLRSFGRRTSAHGSKPNTRNDAHMTRAAWERERSGFPHSGRAVPLRRHCHAPDSLNIYSVSLGVRNEKRRRSGYTTKDGGFTRNLGLATDGWPAWTSLWAAVCNPCGPVRQLSQAARAQKNWETVENEGQWHDKDLSLYGQPWILSCRPSRILCSDPYWLHRNSCIATST